MSVKKERVNSLITGRKFVHENNMRQTVLTSKYLVNLSLL